MIKALSSNFYRASICRAILTGTAVVTVASSSLLATEKLTVEDVLAVEADPDYGAYLAGECLTCHTGKNSNNSIPDINGKDIAYIAGALIEYQDKTRENETMRSIASALGKEEIVALAAYFSDLPE